MVVACNIFEEWGVIFTNTFIILFFLVLRIFIYCRQYCNKVVFVEIC